MTGPGHEQQAGQPETIDEARQQIDRTREQLGETVHALAEKADVKAQVGRKIDETKARVSEKAASLQTSMAPAGTAGGDPMGPLKQATEKVVTATRANPLAALAVALFVGWLFGRKSRRKAS